MKLKTAQKGPALSEDNESKGFARLVIIIVIGIVLLFAFRIVSEHFLAINSKKDGSPAKNITDILDM